MILVPYHSISITADRTVERSMALDQTLRNEKHGMTHTLAKESLSVGLSTSDCDVDVASSAMSSTSSTDSKGSCTTPSSCTVSLQSRKGENASCTLKCVGKKRCRTTFECQNDHSPSTCATCVNTISPAHHRLQKHTKAVHRSLSKDCVRNESLTQVVCESRGLPRLTRSSSEFLFELAYGQIRQHTLELKIRLEKRKCELAALVAQRERRHQKLLVLQKEYKEYQPEPCGPIQQEDSTSSDDLLVPEKIIEQEQAVRQAVQARGQAILKWIESIPTLQQRIASFS